MDKWVKKKDLKFVNKTVSVMWSISGYILISFIQYQLLKNYGTTVR